jgi:hypothetical protein
MKFYTYIHRTADDGRIFYVGKGVGYRLSAKNGRNKYWHNIVNKHGFRYEVCSYWDTDADAYEHEKLLILCFKDLGITLANLNDGGKGGTSGRKMPTGQYEKHVARVRLQAQDPIRNAKISDKLKTSSHHWRGKPPHNKGKPILSHVKEAMMRKHVSVNPDAMQKMIAAKTGVPLSAEHKQKLSLAHKGKPKSDAMKAKLAKSKTGYKYSDEARAKMRASRLAFLAKQKKVEQ